ncbi:hypothetical protein [Deinococcus misasensis]|uniref:hypothetical protein n=1 Tax=Deinococcus misasensis TaxID=392413 RepID=UPI000557452A|nr:hypothetical protein [Deinococcus misasensis]
MNRNPDYDENRGENAIRQMVQASAGKPENQKTIETHTCVKCGATATLSKSAFLLDGWVYVSSARKYQGIWCGECHAKRRQ